VLCGEVGRARVRVVGEIAILAPSCCCVGLRRMNWRGMSTVDGRLRDAAVEGDVAGIEAALRSGARVNVVDSLGRTLLHVASQEGRVEAIRALLAGGADVHAATEGGWTPLHMASAEGHVEAITALLAGGAFANRRRDDGATPLQIATEKSHLLAVKALLAAGADVHAANWTGATSLHVASLCGHVGVITALLGGGANVNAAKWDGATPLHIALEWNHIDAVTALLAGGAAVNAAHKDVMPLHIASREGHVDAVKALIALGADTRLPTPDGTTPLHAAADAASKRCVLALLAAGADPTVQDKAGLYPIQRVPNTTAAPIIGDPSKEAVVDALETAMVATLRARADGSLPAFAGTLRASQRRLLLPLTAEAAITPAQIAAATLDAVRVAINRTADGLPQRLGGGSFGHVYAGTYTSSRGVLEVAVKVMEQQATLTPEQQLSSFWCEVVLHRSCSTHPGIVQCHGGFIGEDEDGRRQHCMVLELCACSLADALHGRVVDVESGRRDPATYRVSTPPQRLSWAGQLVKAFTYLHARDVVHGDIKSENVLLDGDGNVKVTDLGGAALRRDDSPEAADAAHMGQNGSPAYMCPALALGRASLTKASDVYSCGVLLWEVLSGQLPYSLCRFATADELYRAVAGGARPATPDQFAALLPQGIGDLISRMWHTDPRRRPPMEDVDEELTRLSKLDAAAGGAAAEMADLHLLSSSSHATHTGDVSAPPPAAVGAAGGAGAEPVAAAPLFVTTAASMKLHVSAGAPPAAVDVDDAVPENP